MRNLKQFEAFARGKQEKAESSNTCVIYTRVSTKEQAENNMSLDTQRRACEKFAKKLGHTIMAYFGGTYESAKTDERKEFNHMLSFVRKSREKIGNIIVYSVDRFSRSGANAIYIAEQLKQSGISVLSVSQPADVSTPSGSLQQNIQFIFSEYDNQLRREKCIAGMRDKLLRGEWCVKPPIGYDSITKNGKQSIVMNKEGELIRKAFLWFYYERISQLEILARLRAMGIKMSRSHISTVFRNPFYCGVLSNKLLGGKVVQGKQEKIISPEIFLEINNILRAARPLHPNHIGHENISMVRFLFCIKCRKKMTGYIVKKKNIFYYKCSTNGCRVNKNANALNTLFCNLLTKVKIDEQNHPGLKKDFAANFITIEKINRQDHRSYLGNRTVIKKKIEFLESRYVLNEISEELYKKHLKKLQDELQEVEALIEKTKISLRPIINIKEEAERIINTLPEVWSKGDLKTKRLIQSLIFPNGILYDKLTDLVNYKKAKSRSFP